jgi:hypothetical protein
LQRPAPRILDDPRPDFLGLTDDDGVGAFQRFVGHRSDVKSAENHLHAPTAKVIGEPVRFVDLSCETGNRDEIEVVGDFIQICGRTGSIVEDLVIRHVVGCRSQPGQREQPEARQLRDDFFPLDEPRHRKAERQQFGIPRPHATHRNETDFHGNHCRHGRLSQPASSAPKIRAVAGTMNRIRHGQRQAVRRQTGPIVSAPSRKHPEINATMAESECAAAVQGQPTFKAPRAISAM